jgi:hypothetical protein
LIKGTDRYPFRKKRSVFPGRECSEHFARKFERKISDAFSEPELNALAKQTGFRIRRSKLTPTMFVDTLLFKEMDNGSVSRKIIA